MLNPVFSLTIGENTVFSRSPHLYALWVALGQFIAIGPFSLRTNLNGQIYRLGAAERRPLSIQAVRWRAPLAGLELMAGHLSWSKINATQYLSSEQPNDGAKAYLHPSTNFSVAAGMTPFVTK